MNTPNHPGFPYRLAAIDIDDTLVGHDKKIGAENRRAVADLQAAGCEVILASGRRHENMLFFARALGLGGFMVSCQGARTQHIVTGEVIHRARVESAVATALIAEGQKRGLAVLVWLENGIWADARSSWVHNYGTESGGDPVTIGDLSQIQGETPEKIVWAGNPTEIAATERTIRGHFPGIQPLITNDWYLEFTSPQATKAAGIAAVAGRLGIPREAVLTFGDGNNDISMLEWAGLGVAMPHGRAAARQAAPRVGPEGDAETALARAIDSLLAAKAA